MLFCSTGLERDRVNEILTVRLYPRTGEILANVIRHSNDLNFRKVESTGSRCLPVAKILYVRQDGSIALNPGRLGVRYRVAGTGSAIFYHIGVLEY